MLLVCEAVQESDKVLFTLSLLGHYENGRETERYCQINFIAKSIKGCIQTMNIVEFKIDQKAI